MPTKCMYRLVAIEDIARPPTLSRLADPLRDGNNLRRTKHHITALATRVGMQGPVALMAARDDAAIQLSEESAAALQALQHQHQLESRAFRCATELASIVRQTCSCGSMPLRTRRVLPVGKCFRQERLLASTSSANRQGRAVICSLCEVLLSTAEDFVANALVDGTADRKVVLVHHVLHVNVELCFRTSGISTCICSPAGTLPRAITPFVMGPMLLWPGRTSWDCADRMWNQLGGSNLRSHSTREMCTKIFDSFGVVSEELGFSSSSSTFEESRQIQRSPPNVKLSTCLQEIQGVTGADGEPASDISASPPGGPRLEIERSTSDSSISIHTILCPAGTLFALRSLHIRSGSARGSGDHPTTST